ncbi:hypothetical protein [Gemmiger sp.]
MFEALFKRRLNTFQTPRARRAIPPPIRRFNPQKGQKNFASQHPANLQSFAFNSV